MTKPTLVFVSIAVALFCVGFLGAIYGAPGEFVIPIFIMFAVFLFAGQKLYEDQDEERDSASIDESVQNLARFFRRS